jgi:hypothetical protein
MEAAARNYSRLSMCHFGLLLSFVAEFLLLITALRGQSTTRDQEATPSLNMGRKGSPSSRWRQREGTQSN